MKITRQYFTELISVYLDGEATQEELYELAKAISESPEFAEIFRKQCRIHAAMCKLYGREPNFERLELPNTHEKISKKYGVLEWSAIAALLAINVCIYTFFINSPMSDSPSNLDAAIDAPTSIDIPSSDRHFNLKSTSKANISKDKTAIMLFK